jgi:formate hydrogenlyase subunit 4
MTQPPPPPGNGPQYQPPGYGQYPQQPVRQTSSDAIVALVLAILSWVVCPVILAVVALVFAGKAKTAISASNGWLDGGGMVTAAKIIAWANIVLTILGVILFIVIAVFAANTTPTDFPTDFPTSGNAVLSLLG